VVGDVDPRLKPPGRDLAVSLAQLLQQPSGALDVREEEGDGADRELVDRAHGQVLPPSLDAA
jgi:hypothetical protein